MGNATILSILMCLSLLTAAVLAAADQPVPNPGEQHSEKLASQQKFKRLQKVGLPNAIQVQPNFISGGQPTLRNGFRSLSELGIQTILSVDGIQPDLDSAKKFGIRYIHLPLGYQGISDDEAKTLAHIILKQDGPIYIHCHHGKHRSPAAAAVACITAGLMTNETAMILLEQAGTGSNYKGLFKAVTDASPVSTSELIRLSPILPQRADVPHIVESMTQMDQHMVQLKLLQQDQTEVSEIKVSSLTEHATLLNDHFKEILRRSTTRKFRPEFQSSLVTSKQAAIKLQSLLEQSTGRTLSADKAVRASALVGQIANQCQKCHSQFRDSSP